MLNEERHDGNINTRLAEVQLIKYPLSYPKKVSPESLIDALLVIDRFCELNNLVKEKIVVEKLYLIIWETL